VAIVGQYGSVSQIAARVSCGTGLNVHEGGDSPARCRALVRKTDRVTYDAFVIRTGYDHTAAKGLAP